MKDERIWPTDEDIENGRFPDWLTEEVDRQVNELIGEDDYLGRCYIYWAAKKKILHDKYGIDWKTPAEEFPTLLFD